MIRGFWLALPILLIVALDGGLTLLGQGAAYWRGSFTAVHEANPVGAWFLGYGPKAFALALAGWAGIVLLMAWALPGILGRTFYGTCLLAHGAGAVSWACAHAKGLLQAASSRMDGSSILDAWAASPHAKSTLPLSLMVLASLVTSFCWARAGVLAAPKTTKKPGGSKDAADRGDKKKDT